MKTPQAGKPQAGQLATPDPTFTYETALALAGTIITNVIVAVGLDFSETKKAAILGVVNGAVTVAFLAYAAIVRHGRAVGNTSR